MAPTRATPDLFQVLRASYLNHLTYFIQIFFSTELSEEATEAGRNITQTCQLSGRRKMTCHKRKENNFRSRISCHGARGQNQENISRANLVLGARFCTWKRRVQVQLECRNFLTRHGIVEQQSNNQDIHWDYCLTGHQLEESDNPNYS